MLYLNVRVKLHFQRLYLKACHFCLTWLLRLHAVVHASDNDEVLDLPDSEGSEFDLKCVETIEWILYTFNVEWFMIITWYRLI